MLKKSPQAQAAERRAEAKRVEAVAKAERALRVMTKAMRNLLDCKTASGTESAAVIMRDIRQLVETSEPHQDAAAALWLEGQSRQFEIPAETPDEGEYQWMEANR